MDSTQKKLDDRSAAEAVCAVNRAAALMNSGQTTFAVLYMAERAIGYRKSAQIERSRGRDRETQAHDLDVIADGFERALHDAGFLGTPAATRISALEAITPLTLDRLPADYVGPWVAQHHRIVPNPHHVGANDGFFINISTIRSGEICVEVEIYPPEKLRNGGIQSFYFKTIEESLIFGGRMAALAEALIAVELEAYRVAHAPAAVPAPTPKGQLSLLGVVS